MVAVYQAFPIGNRDITIISGSGITKTETVTVPLDTTNTLCISFKK